MLTLRGPSEPRRGAAMRELGILTEGAVLIDNGRIAQAHRGRRIENLAEAHDARELDATGKVVAPGFVDSHTHLVCGPPRLNDYELQLKGATYEDIAASGGGILESVRAVRDTGVRRLTMKAAAAIAEFVRHGTTIIEAKSGYGLDEAGERKALRIARALDNKPADILPTYLGAHVIPPEYAGRADEYIDWTISHMLPALAKRGLAQFADVYCDDGAFTLEQARRYLRAASALGFLLKIHAEQFSHTGAARLAVELGAASADHLDCADAEDARALAGSPTIATLLPGAVFHLGLDRYPPARMLIDAGAAVALATDFNPGTSPTCSMPMVLSLACSRMRMTPAEAFSAATINAAHALRCSHRAGSIEAGKDADLVIFDVPDYREIPYHFGVNLVSAVVKRGVVVYERAEVKCPAV